MLEKVCLSRKETIEKLKEKIYRIFAEMFNLDKKFDDTKICKIWKLDAKYSVSIIQDLFEKNQKVELLNCKKLEDKMSLEVSLQITFYFHLAKKLNFFLCN